MPSARSVALALMTSSTALSGVVTPNDFGPTLERAREKGPQIFNAVHNAMRQFGSSLNHNGMSLFPAVIPEGVILYHGAATREVPDKPDWLAFEIEHAENFAHSWERGNGTADGERCPRPREAAIHIQLEKGDGPPRRPPVKVLPGYLHLYRAERALNVLYLDGTSAGKTSMGTLDTQDVLLTNSSQRIPWDDFGRADDLCSLAQKWNIDGFIRMEIGFEVIYCDFASGLTRLSATRRPDVEDPGNVNSSDIAFFEWARAVAQRYQGIGSSRVLLDYSSMLSAFFYPINLTNPDAERPELPRLLGASDKELEVMKQYAAESVAQSIRLREPVDWQGVTDMITSRYALRLPFIAQADSIGFLRDEVNHLLNTYIDYSEDDEGFSAAQQRCTDFYLHTVRARTPQDHLLYAAIHTTSAAICAALFGARKLVVEDSKADESATLSAAKGIISNLTETLGWSEWKECGGCQLDEICYIAMWPFGNDEDHYNPSCLHYSVILDRMGYWDIPGKTPGHRPPPPACADGQSCAGDDDSPSEEL
ncbi:hypothetical protein GGR52DRAFT_249048 [Hypoxylon sp. FL1284]|nr:hypothetical protein GGR52DRAFT_249048 [Hypoxylon sp. FL1284]